MCQSNRTSRGLVVRSLNCSHQRLGHFEVSLIITTPDQFNTPMYNALIRTHHITSRKKVAALTAAAKEFQCFALLRSGGSPGVMYVQGNRDSVQNWVSTVRNLRYKDYQLVSPVAATSGGFDALHLGSLEEVGSVKEMAEKMQGSQLIEWWRHAMGFSVP